MIWEAPWVTVEVGYGSTWQTEPASITWTDETAKVLVDQRVKTTRGASAARGKVDVGTASFSLSNEDRRFDPTHATGDLFGSLLPGTPVRLLAWPSDQLLTVDGEIVLVDGLPVTVGSAIELWSGTVPSWPQRYDKSNRFAWCPIGAFDRFDKLSRAKIPRSVLEAEILADSPNAFWPLDEASGTTMVDHSGNGHDGEFNSEVTLGGDEVAVSAGRAATFGERSTASDVGAAIVDSYPVTMEATIRIDEFTNVGHVIMWRSVDSAWAAGYSGLYFTGLISLGMLVYFIAREVGVYERVITSTGQLTAGEPHHVVLVLNDSTDWEIWIDGVSDTVIVDTPGSPAWAPDWTFWSVGGTPAPWKTSDFALRGSGNCAAVYGAALSQARIEAHAAAALAPLEGQTSDERIGWVLDQIDWPSNLRDLSVGRSILGVATFKPGDGALEYLRLIEATEDGRLFIGPDGSLVFHDRYSRYLETVSTTSQFTFTDQTGGQGYADFQLDLDDELLVNVARYTRRDGTEQVATDATSVTTYGEAEDRKSDLLSTTDAQVRSLAEWAVATKSTPLPRVPKIRIPLHRYSAADQATVLGLDLGHRVSVNRTPQGVGAQIDLDFIVDGVSHDVGFNEWWVDLFVSPVPQDTAELFILGSSELGGTHILAH